MKKQFYLLCSFYFFFLMSVAFSQQQITITPNTSNWQTGNVSRWLTSYEDTNGPIRAGDDFWGESWRGYAAFDINSIPSNAIITDIALYIYTSSTSPSPSHNLIVKHLTVNPTTTRGQTLYNDIGSGYPFINTNWNAMQNYGFHYVSLNNAAIADLQAQITSNNFWAIGIQESSDNDDWGEAYGWNNSNKPYCVVTFGVPILSVTPNTNNVNSAAGTTAFNISNTGLGVINYSSNDNANWLIIQTGGSGSLSAGQSRSMLVSFTANNTMSSRLATITITAPDVQGSPKFVTVLQEAAQPILNVTPNSRSVTYLSGTNSFDIINTGTGVLNYFSNDNADWLTIQTGGNGYLYAGQGTSMLVSFTANNTTISRVATITITAPGALGSPKSVTVFQEAAQPILHVTPNVRSVAYFSGTTPFDIINTGTGVLNYSSNDNADWLTIQSGGSGSLASGQSTNMLVSFTANNTMSSRVATITITAPGALGSPKYVTITQVPQPQFIEQTSISLTQVAGSAAWGDYDNDNDLDLLLTGYSSTGPVTKIYRNEGNNTFAEQTSISLTNVAYGSIAWGDYDNDGDLDILLTGHTLIIPISKIYRNNGDNTFTELTSIALPGVYVSSAAWGDYDNDGDLDILLTGSTTSFNLGNFISKIYRNDGNDTFTEQTSISLPGVCFSSVAWGDYDNDEDLDILLTGLSEKYQQGIPISKIYRNNGDNTFTEQASINLRGLFAGSAAWGDYDNDGDLDILLTADSTMSMSSIYRNNGDNSFTEQISISIVGVTNCDVAWGDYENDGNLDILLTGSLYYSNVSKIYRNNNDNTFTEQTSISLPGVRSGSVTWGDYDNDGDLDILLTGVTQDNIRISKIFRNYNLIPNSVPDIPGNLSATFINEHDVTLSWNKSSDNETGQNGLSYNLVIGSSPNGMDILSPMSDISTGYRRVACIGNTNHSNNWLIKGLPEGEYYWSVQAIDNSFAASPFSTWHSFAISAVTPEQMVQDILDDIEELVNIGSLTQAQAQPLITKLQDVLDKITNNQVIPAINQLNAFINQVNAYINSGKLTQEQGQFLITAAQELIDELLAMGKKSEQLSGDNSNIPEEYKLDQNYPNPFNPVTSIKFQIVDPGLVTLKIYDILGKEVARIIDEELEAGYYNYQWDASELSSGVYIYRITAGNYTAVKKMILMK